ncbi:Protein of unknown function (DUF3644) [Butyrivibrio fibrisolvens 16/4]|nr:Protein of unknown function (DUF3644) [Butyrivibrio fibrisolvens 16/4]
MSRGKSITKVLLDSSQAALFAGIEIHNKPHISYRYPTAVVLIINAWELALKAYIYKYVGKTKIYEKSKKESDRKHTISFSVALNTVYDDVKNKEKNQEFLAIRRNLELLNEYRCSNVHFAEQQLDPIIFMLISKAVLNYDVFLKKYFKRDVTKDDNLIILPVGFKLPFDPITYLKQDLSKTHNDYVMEVIGAVKELEDNHVEENIVVGFDVYTASVKKVEKADLIAAIDQQSNGIRLTKEVKITDNPNAPEYRIIDEPIFPLDYNEVRRQSKQLMPSIKFNADFNHVMSEIKKDRSKCEVRYLDPKKKSGVRKDYYSEDVPQAVVDLYTDYIKEKA